MPLCDVVRRIGGWNSNQELHRVLADGDPLSRCPLPLQAIALSAFVPRITNADPLQESISVITTYWQRTAEIEVDISLSILVMLNLFQHPWTELSCGAAHKEMARHGS
ncbi:hypothetical protein ACWKWJ_09325 [Sphingopyxis terrae subsp. ummariensis]